MEGEQQVDQKMVLPWPPACSFAGVSRSAGLNEGRELLGPQERKTIAPRRFYRAIIGADCGHLLFPFQKHRLAGTTSG